MTELTELRTFLKGKRTLALVLDYLEFENFDVSNPEYLA